MKCFYHADADGICAGYWVVDVSKIAIKRGGGGHKGAAGFQCKRMPFKKATNI